MDDSLSALQPNIQGLYRQEALHGKCFHFPFLVHFPLLRSQLE